jgi:hypothetical protein
VAKVTNTTGLINAPKPKPPKPKPSPKNFVWPLKATDEDKQKFAASLQELLPPVKWTHSDLAEALWGRDNFTARNIGKTREWIRAQGRFPNDVEAAYVAQLLEVPMQQLMQPTAPFDPTGGGMVRPMRVPKTKAAQADSEGSKPGPKAKPLANGHDPHDRRWILPEGMEVPNVKLETYKERAGFLMVTISGVMPAQVGRAIMQLADCKPANE